MKTKTLLTLLALALCGAAQLKAQGTAFTYQGRLVEGGSPANGSYEFAFQLFDAVTNGNQIGSTNTREDVAVTNGLFTVQLDFGMNAFTGPARWLDIQVRPSDGPGFTALAPRHELTSTPYAIRAQSAVSVPSGAITSTMLADGAVTAAKIQPGAVSQLGTPDGTDWNVVQVTSGGISPGAQLLFQVQDGASGGYTNLNGAHSVAVAGNLLAVSAEGDSGVTLLDITNPQAPILRAQFRDGDGTFTNLNQAWAVAMTPNLLAVAALTDDAVTLVDVSNPASPIKLSAVRDGVEGWDELNGATAVAISGNLMAIGAFIDSAVTLADISNPSTPMLRSVMDDGVAGFTNLSNVRSVALDGSLLAIGSQGDNAVTLVDVSSPASPVKRAELRDGIGGFNYLNGIQSIALSGGLLAIAAESAVTLVSVSNPASPVKLAEMRDGVNGVESLAGAQGVTFSGNWLAASAGTDAAVTLFDISNPSNPTIAAVARKGSYGFNYLAGASGIAFAGTNLAVTARTDGALTLWKLGLVALASAVVVEDVEVFDINAAHVELGIETTASGLYGFAAGYRATASHQGAFVWGDSSGSSDVTSSANDQFTVRASGGVRFFSNGGLSAGVSLAPDGTSWGVISDRNAKKNFTPVDGRQILEKLAAVPVQRWHYRWETDDAVPHIGPMAQDFKAAFYSGSDDKTITTQEIDGVALAAIQGLNQKVEEKNAKISALEKRLVDLERLVTTLVGRK